MATRKRLDFCTVETEMIVLHANSVAFRVALDEKKKIKCKLFPDNFWSLELNEKFPTIYAEFSKKICKNCKVNVGQFWRKILKKCSVRIPMKNSDCGFRLKPGEFVFHYRTVNATILFYNMLVLLIFVNPKFSENYGSLQSSFV